jgi:para-aminobenzoate synthetase/4-amino-4-deoxychorismate lyase
MKFLTDPVKPFELIETMLYEPGGELVLLERHMDRLRTSARYFGFALDEAVARRALQDAVRDKGERLRVRLLLSEGGSVTVTTTPLPPASPDAVMRYVVSPTRLNSADIFLFHKTTRRELYDREWQHYSETAGADEVIYLNERGQLAEGSRTTIFLEKEGRLLTPALGSGLLAGTLRAELIASGRAKEAVLGLDDLKSADAVYLGNSVRGLVRAQQIAA